MQLLHHKPGEVVITFSCHRWAHPSQSGRVYHALLNLQTETDLQDGKQRKKKTSARVRWSAWQRRIGRPHWCCAHPYCSLALSEPLALLTIWECAETPFWPVHNYSFYSLSHLSNQLASPAQAPKDLWLWKKGFEICCMTAEQSNEFFCHSSVVIQSDPVEIYSLQKFIHKHQSAVGVKDEIWDLNPGGTRDTSQTNVACLWARHLLSYPANRVPSERSVDGYNLLLAHLTRNRLMGAN